MKNYDIINYMHGINGNVKSTLKDIIKEELKALPNKKFEISGELWDGTNITSIGIKYVDVMVFNDDLDMRVSNLASTEDLFWIADNIANR